MLDSADALGRRIPDQFLLTNDLTNEEVHRALTDISDSLRSLANDAVALDGPSILQMADIDSFSRVLTIAAKDVARFANPLNLAEDVVEQIIAKVIGEPYLVKDWAGEMDDMYTGQVVLNGRNVRTSFLLKGAGLKGPLKPKYLGHNGDQITRMTTQPAELFVVQHVGRVEPSVRKQLQDAVLARRAEGNHTAVGTVWDGVDVARLGVAYGFLDPSTGVLRADALDKDS